MQSSNVLESNESSPSLPHILNPDDLEEKKEKESTESDGFEGCEKRLILMFDGASDLRDIPKAKWIIILNAARCAILNTIQNTECVAHLLSESSLFIFKHKLMIKTCGTTTLLMILPLIIQECKSRQLMIDDVFYSRSNFMFPQNQPKLHQSFDNEVTYLNGYFAGCGVVLGSLHKARWHCYHTNNHHCDKYDKHSKTLEIVLFDLDFECMRYYFRDEMHRNDDFDLDAFIMNGCGIPSKTSIDSYAFEPCGYSLNGILNDKYWTIHITPEKEASFVSFETNYDYDTNANGYKDVIQKVIRFFGPKRFSFAINSCDADVSADNEWRLSGFCGFELTDASNYKFSTHRDIIWANYCEPEDEKKRKSKMETVLDVEDDSRSLWKFIHSDIVQSNYSKSMSYLFSFHRDFQKRLT